MDAHDHPLRQLPLFASLEPAAWDALVSRARRRVFAPKQSLAVEGEPCRTVYFIVRGLVRIYRLSPEGREQVLAYLSTGEAVNLIPALDGGPVPANAEAATESVVYAIPCDHFHALVRRYPAMSVPLAERLAAEVRRLGDMVEGLALHTVRTRLARFLLAQAAAPEGEGHPRRWTQEEIAAHIGTVREMVGRTLRDFAAAGLVRRRRGRIVVVDREGLEREALMSLVE